MTEKCFQRFVIYYLDAEAHLSGRNRASDGPQLLWDHTELLPEHIHKAHKWLPEIREQAELIWSLPLSGWWCTGEFLWLQLSVDSWPAVQLTLVSSQWWKLKMHVLAFVPHLPHVCFGFICSLQKWLHRTRLTTLWPRLHHCQTFSVSEIWSDWKEN